SPPAYITLGKGVVSIDGLARATYAKVTLDTGIPLWSGDDKYKVSLFDRATGQMLDEKAFGVGSISGVVYNGGRGDDRFEDSTNLASTLYGGGGNDYLAGHITGPMLLLERLTPG